MSRQERRVADDGAETGGDPDAEHEWYFVKLSLPYLVHGVDDPEDAIKIAVAEVGRRTEDAPHTRGLDINVQEIRCPGGECDVRTEAVLQVADMAMVGLLIDVEVRARDYDDAKQVSRRELGKKLEQDLPLNPLEVTKADVE